MPPAAPHPAWAQLAAALVNTAPRATNPHEELTTLADAERLLAGCPEPPPRAPTARDVAALRALRPPLLAAFDADDLEGIADALNPLLGRGASGWRMAPEAGGWTLGPVPGTGLAAWVGSHAARGLAEVAIDGGPARLHHCAADDCLRVLADVSRNGARRYCSRTCATRMNVRRHRAHD